MNSRSASAATPSIAVAGLLALAVAMGIGRFAFTPVLPLALREGLLTVEQGGWIAAANYVGYLIGAMTAPHMRLRADTLAMLGLFGTAALTAAMAWPGSALWLLLRLLAGVASAWVFVATSVWCLGTLTRRGAASVSGWVYAGVGIGIALAGAHGLLAATAGVHTGALWLQLGGLALLLALPVAWVVARLPADAAAVPHGASPQAAFDGGATRGIVVCYGVMGFGYILPATFLPVLARSVVDDPRVFGLAWPVFGATAALSTLLGARALRGGHRLRAWALCQLAMGLGVALPALRSNAFTIAASAVLVGATFMVITLAGVEEMRARAPRHATRGVARITAAFALGQIAGPVCAALLLRASAHGMTLALAFAALALLASGGWLAHAAARHTAAQETTMADSRPHRQGHAVGAAERLPMPPAEQLRPEQRAAAQALIDGPRKGVYGPFLPLLRSPVLLERVAGVGEYLRFQSVLEPRIRELATCTAARHVGNQFEWVMHAPLAIKAGVSAEAIEALRQGARPRNLADDERDALDFAQELLSTHGVSDLGYRAALARWGEQGVVELTTLIGYFAMVSWLMNVARTPAQAGADVAGIDAFPQ